VEYWGISNLYWARFAPLLHFLIFDKVVLKKAIVLLLSKMDRIELHINVGRTRLSTV